MTINPFNNSLSDHRYFIRTCFKVFLVIAASANLIAIFIFNYNIPGISKASTNTVPTPTTASAGSESDDEASITANPLNINLPDEDITYDGTGNLDLSKDVTVTDEEGNALDLQIFTSLKPGTSSKNKIIEYSVEDDNGNKATAERNLILGDNYNGPSIEVLGEIPSITEEELNNITTLLIDSNLLKADDGFGLDITPSITSSVKSSDETGLHIITLSVVNMFNDTVAKDISVQVPIDGPVIKLSKNKVTIEKGSTFQILQYVEYARDEDGRDLSSRIRVTGKVQTNTPGEYNLEVYVTDYNGEKSSVKKLKVIVE